MENIEIDINKLDSSPENILTNSINLLDAIHILQYINKFGVDSVIETRMKILIDKFKK